MLRSEPQRLTSWRIAHSQKGHVAVETTPHGADNPSLTCSCGSTITQIGPGEVKVTMKRGGRSGRVSSEIG